MDKPKLDIPVILDFSNYRDFVAARFAYLKSVKKNFSHQYCSLKLRTSKTFLKHVIHGRSQLGIDRIASVAKVLELENLETNYFTVLVIHDQLKDAVLKKYFSNILSGLRYIFIEHGEMRMPDHSVAPERGVFSHWLPIALYEMTRMSDFKSSEEWMRDRLVDSESISLDDVQTALRYLVELGLVVKTEGGFLRRDGVSDETGNPFDQSNAMRFVGNALKSLDVYRDSSKYAESRIMTSTSAVSADAEKELLRAFAAFRNQVNEIVERDQASRSEASRLICISSTLFNVSRTERAKPF